MAAARAPQSLRQHESASFSVAAALLWRHVRTVDLAALAPTTFVSCDVVDGPAARVGSLRRAVRKDGSVWTYRVTGISDAQRRASWCLCSVEPAPGTGGNPVSAAAGAGAGGSEGAAAPCPFSACVSKVHVLPVTTAGSGCLLTWTTVFSSDARPEDVAEARASKRAAFVALRGILAAAQFDENVRGLAVDALPDTCNHVMMADAFPLPAVVSAFQQAGGRLCLIDPDDSAHGRFLIHPSDWLYPVCSSGQNRSQVLRELLLRRTSGTDFKGRVMLAHAALSGVDPYVDDAMSATVATVDLDRTMSGFTDAFGHPRDPRIGEAEFPFGGFYEAGDPFLRSAKAWYTKHLYSRTADIPDGARRVYIVFEKPTHGVLKRLVEANAENGAGLHDTVVVSIPTGDIIAHPPDGAGERNSAEATQYAFDMFDGLLDFSALTQQA